jgi:hypothetical protein
MRSAEPRKTGQILVDLGIVLHGAGTEGIKAGVNAIVPLRQMGEMADDFHFTHFGKSLPIVTDQLGGPDFSRVGLIYIQPGERIPYSPLCPLFENQGFLQD